MARGRGNRAESWRQSRRMGEERQSRCKGSRRAMVALSRTARVRESPSMLDRQQRRHRRRGRGSAQVFRERQRPRRDGRRRVAADRRSGSNAARRFVGIILPPPRREATAIRTGDVHVRLHRVVARGCADNDFSRSVRLLTSPRAERRFVHAAQVLAIQAPLLSGRAKPRAHCRRVPLRGALPVLRPNGSARATEAAASGVRSAPRPELQPCARRTARACGTRARCSVRTVLRACRPNTARSVSRSARPKGAALWTPAPRRR